ncbi:MAG TPA: hypothetical protein VM347_18990 [Nonomuraea sp.]|nr:hypothetical protein [Nonomuraea sp.]
MNPMSRMPGPAVAPDFVHEACGFGERLVYVLDASAQASLRVLLGLFDACPNSRCRMNAAGIQKAGAGKSPKVRKMFIAGFFLMTRVSLDLSWPWCGRLSGPAEG